MRGIGVAVILLNYFSVTLSEYVSSTAYSSLVAMFVIAVLLGIVIKKLTKNDWLAYGVGGILIAGLFATYFADAEKLEGLLPHVMTKLSLFKQFSVFVNGVFDLTAIVYFLSAIAFFLFLSVQSLEKRRYN